VPFPGDPRLRRARPRHGFTSPGYVENLPVRQPPPTDYRKIMRYMPQGIMTLLGYHLPPPLGGVGGALTGYSSAPMIQKLLKQYGFLNQ